FQCVTGWRVSDVKWRGVKLRDVLDRVGVTDEARAVRFYSFDGAYSESLTLEQARRNDVILAYELEGNELSSAHGGPVRLYVPPMYGYRSIKWLGGIEVVKKVVPGYWEQRGYDVDAWVGRSNGRDDDATGAAARAPPGRPSSRNVSDSTPRSCGSTARSASCTG